MTFRIPSRKLRGSALLAAALLPLGGCYSPGTLASVSPPPPLGSAIDELNRVQEDNAEASKFILHQHEFELNRLENGRMVAGHRLNEYGEDHVKKIAEQLRRGVRYPVVVERSQTSIKPGTKYEYPVHFNPELDDIRREVVATALQSMGIADADQRVVVAPSAAQSIEDLEAEGAFYRGQVYGGAGGYGGGMGGGVGGGFGFF